MLLRVLALSFAGLTVACQGTPPVVATVAAAPGETTKAGQEPKTESDEKAKEKLAARKAKQKELRNKERELDAAKVEQQIAELDRAVRQRSIEMSLRKTATDLAKAQQDLEVFLRDVKPREQEEHRISLDQSTHRAEHSKDELNELVAMYEADEFAKTTKELVLKRGRRELEMAERYLAVARKEAAHFEEVALPQRERDLRDKVVDAQHERMKAETEAEKAKLELGLAATKTTQRLGDLATEIQELRDELAKESP